MKKVTLTILLIATLILTCFAFTSCGKEYTVTWQNWDGTVLEVDNVKEETTPTYDGMTPTKEGNEQYAYEFSGWDKEISAVTGDIVYVAQFNEILLSYPIVWQNWDGTILQQSNENYGVTPTYNGETPFREATTEHTYTFSGWTPTVNTVTGNTTYVAQFTAEARKYNVTWQNWDGSVLKVDEFAYGEYPAYHGDTPTKEGDAENSYYFYCWSPSFDTVRENVTYTAEFRSYKNTYYVTWENWDGATLAQSEYEYGAIPEYPDYLEEPIRYSDEQYIYTFAGWSPTIDVVTGHITYVARYTTELCKYTVTWKNWDSTVLESDENVPYGTEPTYNGETPTRASISSTVYIFSGWTPIVNVVTGDVTYYAQFASEPTKFTATWTNWDGTVLEVDENVPYGSTPSYDGVTPTRASDAQYTYTFSSWYPSWTSTVREDVTFVALYNNTINTYTVTWKNWDGTVIKTDEVEYGRTPSYSGQTPTKEGTNSEIFDFIGWDKPQTSVEGDQTYVAVFNDVQIYQVKYNLDGGSASGIENTFKRVNESYYLTNVIPTKSGYRFLGWNNVHESRVYAPGEYFYGNFDVEFYALWERYELCSTCEGNGYLAESCSTCDGKGEWDETCGNHDNGYKCPRCGTKYNFIVINGIGQVCSSCYVAPTYTPCERCGGDKLIHKTCSSCNSQGYIKVTCNSCEGSKGDFEEEPSLSYKTTSKVELIYIEGYEYSMDGRNWQAAPLFENLAINTQYTFYQRRASNETVPFGPTSTPFVVTTDDYYSVTYELDGGSSNSNPDKYSDNIETVLSGIRKTGYTFLGWYDTDGNKIEALGNGIYGDLVLYAKWNDGNLYTVSFNVNGGNSEIEPMTVQYGKEYSLPTPVRTGYKFSHWYTNTNGNIPSPSIQGTWTIAQDVELTAYWEVIYYNITYVLDGGYYEYGQARYSYTIERDTFTLSYPQKTGYTFIGWIYEGQDTPVLDVTIPRGTTGDKEFTAQWVPNTYTIKLDANGGEIEDNILDVFYGNAYMLSTPTRTGYTFDGWYNGDTKYSSGTWEGTENLELVAKWTANTYTITYKDTIARVSPPPAYVEYLYEVGSSYKISISFGNGYTLPIPTRNGYAFDGWYNGEKLLESGIWTTTSDVVLVARWERIEYSITYNLNGGTNSPNNSTYYSVFDDVTLSAPTRPGYIFLGWTGSNGDVPQVDLNFNGTVRCDLEYTAHWEVDVFTVDYVLNGGTNPSKNPTAITVLDEFALKDPTRTGYTFKGWYLDDAFTLPVSSLSNITSDITLYARFIANQYSATFISDPVGEKITIQLRHGEGVNTVTHHTISKGASFNPYEHIIIDDKDWLGEYIFAGWYLDANFTKRVSGDVVLYSDTTLYAKRILVNGAYDKLPTDGQTLQVQGYSWGNYVCYYVPDNVCKIHIKSVAYNGNTAEVRRDTSYGYVDLTYVSAPTGSERKEVEGYFAVSPGDILYFNNGAEDAGYAYSVVSVVETYSATVSFGPYSVNKTISYDSAIPDCSVLGSGCVTDRAGYKYVGWVDEDGVLCGETWNFLENKTFTAKWEIVDYEINYVLDGGTNSPLNPEHYNVSQSITLKDATKEGYTFEGWYSDAEFTQEVSSIKYTTGEYTLYAKFTPNSYTANLDFDGGASSPTVTFISDGEVLDSQLFTSESSIKSYYPPIKDGYVFGGWYFDESYETVFDFSAVITEDTTLYAKWISSDLTCHRITGNDIETESIVINGTNEIMVTFVPLASGEITISTASQLDVKGILYDQNMVIVVEANDISDEDYNFSITYYVEAGKQYAIAIKGATTLTQGDCSVLFDFGGNMGISGMIYTSFSFAVIYDSSFELPTPTKEGYEFLGWFDENGNEVTSSTWSYAQDMTLYARWLAIN